MRCVRTPTAPPLACPIHFHSERTMQTSTGLEKWQNGINQAHTDARWHALDCDIQRAVQEYNQHLAGVAGYRALDWQLVKAMVWVETGPASDKWRSNPMQIGNAGDPGLSALLSGKEGGDLIIPPAWQNRLTAGTAVTSVPHNLRAGIGYLLMRMANYAIQSVPDPDSTVYEATLRPGDSLAKIAKTHGSTVAVIQRLNPGAQLLRPGQVVKYQKAAMRKVIAGWKLITPASIARYYNVGDARYAAKLDYALSVIAQAKGAACAA